MPYAIVTGASSGIGFASALELQRRGYTVFACARRLEKMEALKKKGIITVKCDVTSAEDVKAFKELILAQTNSIDILFNNAGILNTYAATDVSDEDAFKCFNVNVLAPVRMTREFAPLLKEAQGVVAFTGSSSGIVSFPFLSIYSASKAAIHSYASCLHLELGMMGIRVVNLVSGAVDTGIIENTPLPEDSLFNFPEGLATREAIALAIEKNKPQSPEYFAKNAVNDIINAKPWTLNKYRGAGATTMAIASSILPGFVIEWLLKTQFNMYPAIKKFSKKNA